MRGAKVYAHFEIYFYSFNGVVVPRRGAVHLIRKLREGAYAAAAKALCPTLA